jgi:hypothetical protein
VASTGSLVISRADMARRLGVSRAAVTRACKAGGRLAPAVSGSGVNCLHDAARLWLAQRKPGLVSGPSSPRSAAARPPSAPIPVDEAEPGDPEDGPPPSPDELERELGPHLGSDLDALAEPLGQLTELGARLQTLYGEARDFERWVKCRKLLEEARKAEHLRGRIEGRLIARTTVVRMVDHADVAFRLLLSDAPRTIATRLSCPDIPAATAMIRELMSQALSAAREQMAAALEADDPMVPLAEAAE